MIPFFSDFDITNYCTIRDANITLNASNVRDLSILYLNIVSLPSNMNDLHHLLSQLDKKPDLIALSDIKLTYGLFEMLWFDISCIR